MMTRYLAVLPPIWGGLAAAEISDSTGVSLALFVGGVGCSLAFAWWVRGERDRDRREIDELRRDIDGIEAEIKGLYIDIKALSYKEERHDGQN